MAVLQAAPEDGPVADFPQFDAPSEQFRAQDDIDRSPKLASPVHLLKVIRGFEHDGPGILVLDLLRSWSPQDIRVSLLSLSADGPMKESIEAQIRRLGGEIRYVPAAWRKWRECAQYISVFGHLIGATHLHAHLIRADMMARPAARKLAIPYFVTEHGLHGWAEKTRLLRPAVKAWYRWYRPGCITICAISRKVRRDLLAEGIPEQDIRLVENGVNLEHFHALSENDIADLRQQLGIPEDAYPVISVLGSLQARKSPETVLRVLGRLNNDPALRPLVLFVGEGPLYRQLLRKVRRKGLGAQVRFCRHFMDPAPLLNASDLLLHPAQDEPFGLAVAEAQATGLPVVTRASSGADELLPDAPHKFCVAGNDPGLWVAAIKRALATPRAQVRESLRAHACRRFDISRTAEEYLSLYRAAAITRTGMS